MTESVSLFRQLLDAAAAEPQPQRLLFVFAGVELPSNASPEQAARHAAGKGGALTPLACVDKDVDELCGFDALVEESRNACPPWSMVFVGALDGQSGRPPSPDRIQGALRRMVQDIREGRLAGYLVLDPQGQPLQFA